MIDIHFYFWGSEHSKGLAIIQDFTAHWAMKNEQMANVWKFDSMPDSYENILHSNCDNSDSILKVQTFAICSFFIAQWAVKSWIIARPLEFSYP